MSGKSALRCCGRGLAHILFTQIYAYDLAAEQLREMECAGPAARGDIKYMRFACQCEQLAEALSEPGSSGVEAVSEQQAREIAAVKRGAAPLNVLLFHVYPLAQSDFADLKQ